MARGYPDKNKHELDNLGKILAETYTDIVLGDLHQADDIYFEAEHKYKVWRLGFESSLKKIQEVSTCLETAIDDGDTMWRFYRDAVQAGTIPTGLQFDVGIGSFSKRLEEDLAALDRLAVMSEQLAEAKSQAELAKKKKEAETAASGAEAGTQIKKHPGGRPEGSAQPLVGLLTRLASDSYFRVTGSWPGQSHSHKSPFMRFLIHTIANIPEEIRPPVPSTTTVANIVREWKNRSPAYQQGEN